MKWKATAEGTTELYDDEGKLLIVMSGDVVETLEWRALPASEPWGKLTGLAAAAALYLVLVLFIGSAEMAENRGLSEGGALAWGVANLVLLATLWSTEGRSLAQLSRDRENDHWRLVRLVEELAWDLRVERRFSAASRATPRGHAAPPSS